MKQIIQKITLLILPLTIVLFIVNQSPAHHNGPHHSEANSLDDNSVKTGKLSKRERKELEEEAEKYEKLYYKYLGKDDKKAKRFKKYWEKAKKKLEEDEN